MGARILIVEDEAVVALELQTLLRRMGHEVSGVAATAKDAQEAARGSLPDLALMDIHLAGEGDGIGAAVALGRGAGVPSIFLTAYADSETLARAKRAEPYGYIVKPFQESEVRAAVEMALHKIEADRKLAETAEELRRTHQELEDQKRFFETLFASIPSGVLVVDSSQRVRAVNPHSEVALGLDADGSLDRTLGAAMGCPQSHQGICGSLEASSCQYCGIHTAIRKTFGGEPANRQRTALRSERDGKTRVMDLLITTGLARIQGEELCIVLLEDVTELDSLRQQVRRERSFAGIVGRDDSMTALYENIRELAGSSVPVLIQGESGTGKELVASAIHNEGPRRGQRFVAVNCGALPENLLESELFGHVRGSFTGALRDKKGRFELAAGGTLFLDEVAELSPLTQVKLLRVLQDGTFEPVGSERTMKVDVRVISATHKDLCQEVAGGRFRGDLYYRLCVVPLHLPALRERPGDIPLLVQHFLAKISQRTSEEAPQVAPETLSLLARHLWPGNVRELENVLHFAFIKAKGGRILPEHLPPPIGRGSERPVRDLLRRPHLDEERVLRTIREFRGNKVRAAKMLGVSRSTLYRFMDSQLKKVEETREG